MSDTPVFDRLFAESSPFKALPTEYTDRYTPEVARQQGYKQGAATQIEQLIADIEAIEKPTKQVVELLAKLENRLVDFND